MTLDVEAVFRSLKCGLRPNHKQHRADGHLFASIRPCRFAHAPQCPVLDHPAQCLAAPAHHNPSPNDGRTAQDVPDDQQAVAMITAKWSDAPSHRPPCHPQRSATRNITHWRLFTPNVGTGDYTASALVHERVELGRVARQSFSRGLPATASAKRRGRRVPADGSRTETKAAAKQLWPGNGLQTAAVRQGASSPLT